ncbi:glycoside hydrolase family 16 protein [Suillus clintonianus]|uniref:glycoside hydrolase family 16 protein n=1 Tax=Suillus clintonianus TaxID=1904413 RepID=UPI001B86046D|nr:glycoside hydrolase family 16 protein [Suillus clintonianus]KAG2128597.1 glycoside hydrolase family 16 protein [Suillus clintonianus]
MYSLFKLFLVAFPLITLVGAHSPSRYLPITVGSRSTDKTYTIQDFYQGTDFFNDWDFFTGSDPTGGNVNYQNKSSAESKKLAYVNDSATVLAIDSTSKVAAGGYRDAVRITSQKSYNGGLFIMDASKMPVGCSTWPSFWTVGPDWPYGGEIDIVEGINDQTKNQMTLHSGTDNACTIDTDDSDQYTGSVLNTKCYSTETSDSGCSILDASTTSFAYGFNNADGGVFALLWDNSTGMSMWHFARADIPSDLTDKSPTPSTWGTPSGFWSAKTCDITDNFYDQQMVIDTTICGNWASGAYSKSGCPGNCTDMVANATNYVDAKWVINYVAVYE